MAPEGTVAVIDVGVLAVTTAEIYGLNRTSFSEGTELKFVPVITTEVPAPPDVGVKEVMVGGPGVAPVFIFIAKPTGGLLPRDLSQTPKSKSAPPQSLPPIKMSPVASIEMV